MLVAAKSSEEGPGGGLKRLRQLVVRAWQPHGMAVLLLPPAVTNVVFITAVALMIFLLTCHTRGKEKSHECMSKTSVGEQRCITKSHQQS